ncbi:hypothetical protein PybrP1_005413 [[Pythium] brassicae (nom. inval.)]|nr:hypothetical protein PybrP1_005413 [[Pythium] brassicae (nom. inval.)]
MDGSALDVALAHTFVGANAGSGALCSNSVPVGAATARCAVAFAADAAVAVLTSQPLRVRHTLRTDSSARVTSVFLHSDADGDRVLAGNAAVQTRRRWLYFLSFSDGTLVVFEQRLRTVNGEEADATSVRVLATHHLGVRCIMESLAATALDWQAASDGVAADDDLQAVEESVLLAAGGVDSKVHLFELAGGSSALQQLLALEGHRGWVRGLAFERQPRRKSVDQEAGPSCSLLLASASQDQRIRLWKITATAHSGSAAPDAAPQETQDSFQAAGACCSYSVSFDALLIGHEDWVTSVHWALIPQAGGSDDGARDAACDSLLVSSSMDNALIVWKKNAGASGAWFPSLRVGEINGNGLLKGVVLPSASGRLDLLALGFSGQLERWTQQPAPSTIFRPSLSPTGHCASVTDLSWSPGGDYVLSVSLDQTARVVAPAQQGQSWHEISRAQVHGYDLNCACFLLGSTASRTNGETRRNDRFVSGADEKILRVFEAPDDIQRLVAQLSGDSVGVSESSDAAQQQQPRVQHAYLPELSLTNKSAADSNPESFGGYATVDPDCATSIRVPVGETLGKKTLWPELRKLYGHGNELLCVASNHSGSLIASACKSREERFASIWLWNTADWSAAQSPLEGHKSSVVQLAFSPSDEFLVSVSRDRQFCVYAKAGGQFALVAKVKAHKRIIWSCSWSPDSRFFATASRDQTAVTAIAFAPEPLSQADSYIVAVGLESGAIRLFRSRASRGLRA